MRDTDGRPVPNLDECAPSPRRRFGRRTFLKRSALTGAALALSPSAQLQSTTAVAGVRWGAMLTPRGNEDQIQAVRDVERMVGRKFATVHHRFDWDISLVNPFTEWIASHGHTPIISWFARTTTGMIDWASIAAGEQDERLRVEARAIKEVGWPAFFCFHKEPEDEGTATDWVAAYNHVWHIFHKAGVTNLRWVVGLMDSTYRGSAGGPAAWLPTRYDLLGVDGFNRFTCDEQPWKSFEEIFGPAYDFAVRMNKPLFMIEYGSVEGSPGRKAHWLTHMRRVLRSWPRVIGVSYNHEEGLSGHDAGCQYWIDTSRSSVDAFRAMGADPYFQRR
jgi:hypothetical protein